MSASCIDCGHQFDEFEDVMVAASRIDGTDWLCGLCATARIEQRARLIAAGDALRWACRHLVKDIPTGARDWTEWNRVVEKWLEAKGDKEAPL